LRFSQPNPRSILFLITGLYRGGAETQLLLLTRELLSRGWVPTIVSMISGGPLQADFESLGISVTSLGMKRGVGDPRGIVRLARIIRQERPSILHTHMVHANLLGRISTLFATVPVVVSTAQNIREGGLWTQLGYRITDPLVDLTTNVSQAAVERYARVGAVPRGKLRMIPNGVVFQHFGRDSESRVSLRKEFGIDDRFAWLAVGRLETQKDYANLLNAASRLSRRDVLLIAGDGPLGPSLKQLATDLGMAECVRFLGIRKDVAKLMTAADAYVMSSAWEGLPMVLLEAAASSLPIVATDVGGNREIVCDNISGFLVRGKDSAALAEAMLAMERLPEEARRAMGAAGRVHVSKHYSLSAVVDEWESIYRSLLEKQYNCAPCNRPVARA
jgi:glycosyltransferase involved in cell wall biosynthesis